MSESESKSIKKAQKLQGKLSRSQMLEEKFKLEEQLKDIKESYGNLPEKKQEPKTNTQYRWNYILNEMSEMQQYMTRRLECFKFKTKKLAEQAINKRLKYYEAIKEKEKNEEKNQFRQLQKVAKTVQREFWKYVWQIRKQVQQFKDDKIKQETQKQKLGDIVTRLKEVTEEIGQKLSQYQNAQQEDETNLIPIEKFKTLYYELKRRQNAWPGFKKQIQSVQSNIVIDLIKVGQDRYEIAKVESKDEEVDESILDADKCLKVLKKSKQFPFLFEAEDSLLEQQPFLLNGQLRIYQLVGVHWMASLHQQQMNGILADEMGLGKTIQTIALLAYLAANKQIWGPHLVIVPTSILMNWEIEFKRWCPAFKIMTYFGSPKERKLKRQGWSQLNSFHVCITSYKIVIQDSKVFKRKKWYYMILDEAQHIKNFKSQRWQVLLNFNTRSRLLLTGTPLQNDLGEIWSLLHFLMPSIFDSHQDFLQWFMSIEKAIQENKTISEEVLRQLHDILRPFVLRRLKKDVEKQLPEKREIIVKCDLSRRQKYLYDEFIQSSGNFEIQGTDFVTMMNKVQQLRKVCNHPELFEQRPVEQPFFFPALKFTYPKRVQLNLRQSPIKLHVTQIKQRFPSQEVLQFYSNIIEQRIMNKKASKFGKRWVELENSQVQSRFKSNMSNSYRKVVFYHALLTYNPEMLTCCKEQIKSFLMPTVDYLLEKMQETLNEFSCVIRKVDALPQQLYYSPYQAQQQDTIPRGVDSLFYMIQKQRMLFPNKKLLIYDCGKMNTLVSLIYKLKSQNHKIIIFTQMTKMLDLFEAVLSLSKISYLRLDGSTPVEMRQKIVESFNQLNITCFISSTRSGGIGLNLTGADTVIFYDTDWNPAMDKQAQDRCHRIGQVRPVTIYRLITNSTIEENIFLKSLQKRQLDDFVMQSGMFSPEQILKSFQLFDDEKMDQAIKQVEDIDDRQAAQKALIEEQNYQMNGAEEIEEIEKGDNMDWLIPNQLPPIVKYGLKMSDCIVNDNAEIQKLQDEMDEGEEDGEDDEVDQEVEEEEGEQEQEQDDEQEQEGEQDQGEEQEQSKNEEDQQQINEKKKKSNSKSVDYSDSGNHVFCVENQK
ncbi:unnamed protein product (macronuclear) [Paramecium tetraurelia]|uniref:Uncharacterized protein n=1 Tax=Paramecium tetraurelia TaxID=5888 RepID=A0BWP0_PARTE|nr:uncharacterized protein GSPATT00032809001 [Paramecium tetraurelia]CAK62957.1 unnamed protein product [Paramecium tetraurelia]|eukprot:XP_001430355.1 hypothetical protein (macronuclear) [Paramecium tetraurelia strain d4-2]